VLPGQLACELRIELVLRHQRHKVRKVAAERIAAEEQLEPLGADEGSVVDVADVEGRGLVGAVADMTSVP